MDHARLTMEEERKKFEEVDSELWGFRSENRWGEEMRWWEEEGERMQRLTRLLEEEEGERMQVLRRWEGERW